MSSNSNATSSSSSAASSSFRGFADFAKPDFATSSGSTAAAALLAARRKAAAAASITASSSSAATASSTGHHQQQKQQPQSQQQQLRPSPIYTGNDARLSLLFRKISQKRNPTTKVRALEELIAEVFSPTTTTATTATTTTTSPSLTTSTAATEDAASTTTSTAYSRPDKIASLSHLRYLHETKLGYDNNPSVRALSYLALVCARHHVPKAWNALFLGMKNGGGSGSGGSGAVVDVAISSIGMAWGAMYGDPATEVSRNASLFMEELIHAEKEEEETNKVHGSDGAAATTTSVLSQQQPNKILVPRSKIQMAICQYSKMVLSCKRPSTLQEFILNFNTALSSSSSSSALSGPFSSSFGMVAGSSSTAASGSSGGKGKKSKNVNFAHSSSSGDSNDATTTTTTRIAELEKEEMAERYERVILSVLFGMGWLFECCGQSTRGQVSDMTAKEDIYHHASTILFPDAATSILRLLYSSRGSFRRGTYMLLGQICQFAPMLLASSSASQLSSLLSLGSLLPNLLSSEKDPSNFVSLLEMILSYLAAAQGGKIGDNIFVGAFRVGDDRNDMGKQEDGATVTTLLDPVAFTTALSKALRRGCYGAPAGAWGPTILPFVASLPAHHHGGGNVGGEEWKGRIEGEQPQDTKLSQSPSALPLQLTIVSSLWEGRKFAAGVTDTIAIVSAVAECATFLMLRRGNHQRPLNFTAQSWRLCGELLLNTLTYYLMEAPDRTEAYGPVASAVDGLCSTLAQDLYKLDASSLSSVSSSSTLGTDNICVGLSMVKSWFWGQDGIERTLLHEEGRGQQQLNIICRKWDLLLKSLLSLNDGSKQSNASHLIPACKKLFHTIVSNNRPCNDDEGRLLLTILQFGQVDNIFSSCTTSAEEIVDDDGISTSASIERFCVNDLLRCILVHASTYPNTVKIDFDIFQLCMHSIPSVIRQKQIWETILRELIISFCDYTALAIGLETLASSEATRNFVRCQVLDTFAIDTAKSLMNEFRLSHVILHHHDELDKEKQSSTRSGDVSRFLKSCVGTSKEDLSGSRSVIIVSDSVIRRWVDLCSERDDDGAAKLEENLLLEDESGNNILLNTMLDLSFHNKIVISRDEAVKLMSESWFEGGKTWHGCAVKCLNSDEALRDQVISIAEKSLSEDIHSAPPNDDKLLDLICHSWANRAARLIGIHPAGGLASIGIGDVDLWERAALAKGNDAEFLFLCLMYLLDSIGSDNSRRDVLMTNIDVFVHIQAAITKCDADLESFHQRTDRSRQLVDILGGSDMLSRSFLEDSCIHTADLLATYMNSDFASKKLLMKRGLTSLSYLVSILFPFACESHSSDVNPIDVKEGDTVWYERGDHGKRVNATVVKVHTDDFPKLYFTIKEYGAEGERQTVASRLRWTNEEIIENNLPGKDDSAQRDRVGRYIVDKLVRPFLTEHRCDDNDDDDSRTIREFSAESMNIVVSQCGFASLGIGSVRYDIFQAAHSMVEDLCDVLSPSGDGPYLETSISVLRSLALAMGYGFYTIPAQNSVSHLKLDTTESMLQLLQLYENESWLDAQRNDPLNSFHSSVLMWLAVVVGTTTEGELLGRIARVIFSCSDLILFDGSCNVAIDSIHVMNAMSSLISSIDRCINCSSANEERESRVLSKLTQTFIDLSPHRGPWIETFASLLQKKCNRSRSTLIPAATAFSNGLCDCLFVPTKRWCAFQLLNILANEPRPLRPGDDAIIPPNIDQHLSDWKKELDEEESIDLEEDVLIAASWLPENMMTLFLNVGDNSSTDDSEHDMQVVSIGNLLAWVVSLDIVEVAGSVDMRNRAHISSFIQKSNALGFIMNLALQEADLNVSRGANIFDCIAFDLEGRFLLQKIATLALFRSVESLPTMVKTWYNDDCPRFLQQILSSFVESVVAPTTLQRELARIKDATSLGEMSVSGSCVSREVVATYQQDECQLSVMIRMPPTFPLRNVEVDCKKTMGIPESRWRRWALQIMLMLNNQDGSVLDALLLWKQNVDKEFDGVEPCPVCYSVLCIKTHQMPNLECKTCHNRFHTTCLMKWFQSSGKSSCVLCQQPWSGAKV